VSRKTLVISFLVLLTALLISLVAFTRIWSREANLDELPSIAFGESASQAYICEDVEIILPDAEIFFPQKMMVYKIEPVNMSDEQIKDLAARLGISGKVKTSALGAWRAIGEKKESRAKCINVDPETGIFDYVNKEPYPSSPEEILEKCLNPPHPNLPSIDEAKSVARDFLLKTGVLTEEELNQLKESAMVTETRGEWDPIKQEHVVVPLRVGVVYFGELNGYPIMGHARISVGIGHNGEVMQVYYFLPKVKPYTEYPIKSIDEVIKDIRNNKCMAFGIDRPPKVMKISSIKLAYWANPCFLLSKEQVFHPIYYIEGEVLKDEEDIYREKFEEEIKKFKIPPKPKQEFKIHVPAIPDGYYKEPPFSEIPYNPPLP